MTDSPFQDISGYGRGPAPGMPAVTRLDVEPQPRFPSRMQLQASGPGMAETSFMIPPEDDLDAWNILYQRLGRPTLPDDYQLSMPDGLPETFAYSEELARASREWGHRAGLSQRQLDALHGEYVRYMASQQQQAIEAFEASQQQAAISAHEALLRLWGRNHAENTLLASQGLRALGPEFRQTLEGAGLLARDGSITVPAVAEALLKVGRAFSEDRAPQGLGPTRPRDLASMLYPNLPR